MLDIIIGVAEEIGGIRIWNERKKGEINFIADLDFDAFLPLATHILTQLSENKFLALDDPPDPETLIKSPVATVGEGGGPRSSSGRHRGRDR